MVQCLFCKYIRNQVSDFQSVFFSWKLRSICKLWIQKHFCAILGGQDIYETKCGSETDQFIFTLSHSGLKTGKCVQTSANWPKTALIAPKWLLVGLVTQTNWIDIKTVFILGVFKMYRTSKLNNFSVDHNNILIKDPILFCMFLSSLKLHRNGFVFKICVWISVFRRKNIAKRNMSSAVWASLMCKMF